MSNEELIQQWIGDPENPELIARVLRLHGQDSQTQNKAGGTAAGEVYATPCRVPSAARGGGQNGQRNNRRRLP
jgi:hypothetical protein